MKGEGIHAYDLSLDWSGSQEFNAWYL